MTIELKDMMGKVVFDIRRSVIGRVKKIHETGSFISPVNGEPVTEPVVELETGDTFVATPEAVARWAVLDTVHEAFFNDVNAAVGSLVTALATVAAKMNVPPKLTFLMVGRALQVQGGMLLKPEAGEGEGWEDDG